MRTLAIALFLSATALALTACNTVSGLGEDVQAAGSAVTNASEGASSGM